MAEFKNEKTKLQKKIEELKSENEIFIVAIDGMCLSGKTTFANEVAKSFGANVFHIDDFYLPVSERAKDWKEKAGSNIDTERFLSEVLTPASGGKTVRYRAFDCHKNKTEFKGNFEPTPVVIVEGTYSCLPRFQKFYSLKVFMRCTHETQLERLKKRNTESINSFLETWIPLEENYFNTCNVCKNSDIVIST